MPSADPDIDPADLSRKALNQTLDGPSRHPLWPERPSGAIRAADREGAPPARSLESGRDEIRRDATAWPSTHRKVFDEALDKLREALEEVQVTEAALRRQNEELSAAQLEAVIARERYAELFNFAPAAQLVT